MAVLEKALEAELSKYGLDSLGRDWGPVETLSNLKDKRIAGAPVVGMPDMRVEMLLYGSRKLSLKATASGLRNWHGFAVFILQYDPRRTLPPRCQEDVARWLTTFRNHGTACNYLGHVKCACTIRMLDVDWCGEYLRVLPKGLKSINWVAAQGKEEDTKLLTEELVRRLVELADRLGQRVLATLFKFLGVLD